MSKVWTRQPQVFVGPSRLARELGCIRLITGLTGANLYDEITRTFIAPAAGASAITRVLTSRGYGARTNGTTAYWDIPVDLSTATNKQAFLWVGRVAADGTIVVRDDTSSGGTIPVWINSGQFDYRNGATDYTAAGTAATNTDYTVLSTANVKGGQTWVDGNLLINDSNVAVSGITSPLKLSRNGNSGANFDTTTVLFAVFDRPAQAVGRSLSRNPWQLFRPLRTYVRGFTATGGTSSDLTIADALHAHSADGLSLTTDSTLTIADATHGHAADSLSLTTDSTLTVADATHAHTADNIGLTSDSTLTVADATHAHAADNITLDTSAALVVADAAHAHAADGITLSSASVLAVQDALHAHAADSIALTSLYYLAVQDALHAHLADNAVLTLASSGPWAHRLRAEAIGTARTAARGQRRNVIKGPGTPRYDL